MLVIATAYPVPGDTPQATMDYYSLVAAIACWLRDSLRHRLRDLHCATVVQRAASAGPSKIRHSAVICSYTESAEL